MPEHSPAVRVVDLTAMESPRPLVPAGATFPRLTPLPAAPDDDRDEDVDGDITMGGVLEIGADHDLIDIDADFVIGAEGPWVVPGPLEGPPGHPTLHDLAPTGEMIAALWDREGATVTPAPWLAEEVDRTLLADERPRWRRRVLIGLVALAFGLASGYLIGNDGGDDPTAIIAGKAAALVAALDALDPVVQDLGDGLASDAFANGNALSEVDGAARDLFSEAASLQTEEHAELRRTVSDLAANALTVESALGDLTGYGVAMTSIAAIPDLPVTADAQALAELTVEVTAWTSRFAEAAGMLPRSELLDDHRQAALTFADGLGEWQATYLDAIRTGDAGMAEQAVADVTAGVDGLLGEWVTTAGRATAELERRPASLEEAAADLTRLP